MYILLHASHFKYFTHYDLKISYHDGMFMLLLYMSYMLLIIKIIVSVKCKCL